MSTSFCSFDIKQGKKIALEGLKWGSFDLNFTRFILINCLFIM